jgi:glycosyltransferase involved in cell wall biosynthesis
MERKKISVLFLTKYAYSGASSRYRCFQYLPYLEQANIDYTISSLFDDNYLNFFYKTGKVLLSNILKAFLKRLSILKTIKSFNLIVIEYELLPYFPAFLERYLNFFKIPYIVDYDDAIFHRYNQHPNIWIRRILGNKIATVMRYSSLVIVGNNYLADYARLAGANKIQIIPTVIDLMRYSENHVAQRKSKIFTIGWIGSPSTTLYLHNIAPALTKFRQYAEFRICLLGADKKFYLPDIEIENITWSEASEVSLLHQFDVGIMPLTDDSWARGKCGLKLIQYMACGLPIIASPIGVNSSIVEHGINGFLAGTIEEWIQFLLVLYNNPKLRNSMGKAGRYKVERQYCLQITAPLFVQCLQDVAQ